MTCRWVASDRARVVTGRHAADTYPHDIECPGCLPCTQPHCRVCGMVHVDGTCAECLAETRETLRDIARMCNALPEEVEHRGVEGEAMMLLGPAADPEARQHVEAAYLCGRLPEGWIEAAHGKGCPLLVNEACIGCAGGERHPLAVLGTWQMVVADALDHDLGDARVTVADAVDYLDRQLTYLGGYEHVPFEDFARDLRQCRTHMEAVLHDGEQIERGAPCPACKRHLTHAYGRRLVDDRWVCTNPRCDVDGYTTSQYRGWVEEDARNNADRLTAADMALRFTDQDYTLKASVVRVWGARDLVRKRGSNGQGMTLYDVGDVALRVTRQRRDGDDAGEVA